MQRRRRNGGIQVNPSNVHHRAFAVSIPVVIDGSHGEGGGQILRTALTYASLFGRPLRIERIRANRRRPGLAAQHITCIRAAGAICDAEIDGDSLGSGALDFLPRASVRPGDYAFDVAQARAGGSAGSTSLVLQTILLPLARAEGVSRLRIEGGTHMLWSPSYHYLRDTWLPVLKRCGIEADLGLDAWGWFPLGKGVIRATIRGNSTRAMSPLSLPGRGALLGIHGCAVAANLPEHIPQRMAARAAERLAGLGVPLDIEPLTVCAACAGAGIFLNARYQEISSGFAALGARGKPAEEVADEAVAELISHHGGPGAVDIHLADQILVALAIADGRSRYSVPRVSGHLATNAWLVQQFGLAEVGFESTADGGATVTVTPSQR